MTHSSDTPTPSDDAVSAVVTDPRRQRRLFGLMLLPSVAMYATYQAIQQILIPAQIEAIDPAHKVANLAFLTMLSSIAAVIGLLAGGSLSDKTRGRFGRRAPWLVLSALVSGALLMVMGQLQALLAVTLVYTLLWFAANFYQGVLTAVLPDRVPENKRGVAASIIGLGTPVGILLGVNMAARLPASLAYPILAGLFVIATLVFVIFAREPAYRHAISVPSGPTQGLAMRAAGVARALFASFRHRDFALAFLSRAMMFLAYFTISGYMFYILQDYVGAGKLPGGDAKVATGILATITTGVWIVTVAIAGWLADRLNRRKLFVGICSIGMALAMLVPLLAPNWPGMILFKSLTGLFFGTYMAVDLALMSLVLPDREAEGRDMAVLAVATAGPQILSPIIAGGIISAFGYHELFVFGAVMALGSGLLVLMIRSVR